MRTRSQLFRIWSLIALGSVLALGVRADDGDVEDTDEPNTTDESNMDRPSTSAGEIIATPPLHVAKTLKPVMAWKYTDLKGITVEDRDGNNLAAIVDLIIDRHTGRVNYVLLRSGGFLGMGSKDRLVPPEALGLYPANHDNFVLNISSDRWKNAPEFKRDELSSVVGSDRMRDIYSYYNYTPSGQQVASTFTPEGAPTPTGRSTGERMTDTAGASPSLASDLIGHDVINRQNESVGTITDILVNWADSRADFAIVDTTSDFTGDDFAVPVTALAMNEEKHSYVLDASGNEFRHAKPFEAAKWSSEISTTGQPEVFLYQGR